MRYGTVFFDADGTLLDFNRCEREALIETLADFSIDADDAMISEYSLINQSLWELLQVGGILKSELKTRRFRLFADKIGLLLDEKKTADVYMEHLAHKRYYMPEAIDVCRRLAGRCRLYLITNGISKVQNGRLRGSELLPLLSGVFISEEIGYEKPSRGYFAEVESRVPDFLREDTLVVGDSLTSDIAGGIGSGYDVCWYNPKQIVAPDGMKINYTIKTLTELYGIIGV